MKSFKTMGLCLSCFFYLGSTALFAAEETKYIAMMSGIECSACKKAIAKAIAKLDGVKTIRIVKQGKGSHQLEVFTDGSSDLKKVDAVKALKDAKHYKILSWKKDQG
ncbi:MAG: hypothetical protein GY899_17790 [Verrucomicrobiaceae bacterium]|nr:hypothetical protein [Verrucomicrobiaceae bacterium]